MNDATQFWRIFDPPPSSSRFLVLAFVLSSQNTWPTYSREVIYERPLDVVEAKMYF